MIINELIRFGFSDKEARVYLALLEVELATVNEIAKRARINRSSTYVVLESLQKRGLVSVSIGSRVKKYVAASPEELFRLIEREADEKNKAKSDFTKILPELKSAYVGSKQRPVVRIFEGRENMLTQMQESLRLKEKILRVYASARAPHEFYLKHLPKYFAAKRDAGIKTRGIHPDEPSSHEMAKHQPKSDESVFIPPASHKFESDLVIYDSTVAYISHRGEYAITIENQEIADAMKSAFDLAFEGAKQITRKRISRKS